MLELPSHRVATRLTSVLNRTLLVLAASLALAGEDAGAYGVVYAARIAGGMQGGFDQTFCTGLLQTIAYTQPLQTFEANDTFERSGHMSNAASVALGRISIFNSGEFRNPLSGEHYGGGLVAPFCNAGILPGLTQWNDTLTITGSGTFAFSITLASQVAGTPVTQGGGAGHGVSSLSRIEALLDISRGPIHRQVVVIDAVDDGNQGVELRTDSVLLDLDAGDMVEVAGGLRVFLNFSARLGALSWTLDALNTADFFVDPVTPGASYSSESGTSYLSAIPLPTAGWLIAWPLLLLPALKGRRRRHGAGKTSPATPP